MLHTQPKYDINVVRIIASTYFLWNGKKKQNKNILLLIKKNMCMVRGHMSYNDSNTCLQISHVHKLAQQPLRRVRTQWKCNTVN